MKNKRTNNVIEDDAIRVETSFQTLKHIVPVNNLRNYLWRSKKSESETKTINHCLLCSYIHYLIDIVGTMPNDEKTENWWDRSAERRSKFKMTGIESNWFFLHVKYWTVPRDLRRCAWKEKWECLDGIMMLIPSI